MTTETTPTASNGVYLSESFDTFYDSYFQEMASETLVSRWQIIDKSTAFLVASTASGSALAGWALWSAPGWKLGWAAVAGVATVASIGHGVMGVPERVKTHGEVRRGFSKLRVDLETYRQRLKADLEPNEAKRQYDELRDRFSKLMDAAPKDIVYRAKFRIRIQDQLDSLLRKKGVVA
jgi:hypothetical protein